jgi:hypothetical protein
MTCNVFILELYITSYKTINLWNFLDDVQYSSVDLVS